jgi:hypothetical protein
MSDRIFDSEPSTNMPAAAQSVDKDEAPKLDNDEKD